jgi:hypothetical protein
MSSPDKIELVLQPANLPDLNINDLGFFNALQALYYQAAPKNAGEIITMVEAAYNDYPWRKINYLWLTLQSVFNKIVKCNGNNTYSIPHINKEKLDGEDELPIVINACDEVVAYTVEAHPDIYDLVAEIPSLEEEQSQSEGEQDAGSVDLSRVI